jgi:hypothetical protein
MIDEKLVEELREYLKDHYTPEKDFEKNDIVFSPLVGSFQLFSINGMINAVSKNVSSFRDISDDASEYIKKNRKPGGFAHALDQKRKEKKLTPAELYKRANVDRRQYSRLMGPEGRHPSKNTVISFALALRLDRGEFDEFLKTAGYSLSNTSSRDVCIMFCIEKGHYDIDKVNAVLFAVGIEPLSRDTG